MKGFQNLRTATKLLLGFGLMMALFAIMWFTAQRAMDAIAQSRVVAVEANALDASLNEDRAVVLTLISGGEGAERQALLQEVAENGAEAARRIASLSDLTAATPELEARVLRLADLYGDYAEVRDRQTLALVRQGQLQQAREVSLDEQHRRYVELRDVAAALSADALDLGRQQGLRARTMFMVVGLLAMLVAVLAAWILTASIAAPLRRLTGDAERISKGELPEEATRSARDDEVGQLDQAFARMTRSLRQMASVAAHIAEGDLSVSHEPQSDRDVLGVAFATMLRNMRSLMADLHEGITVLSSSAAEISTSTSQLAASASETAAAVSETTTTVEEVRQTAQLSSDKARAVSDTAQRAASVAEEGRRSTEDAAAGMARIQQQMELIAESMVRLSEQSQAVGQIVASVEDLAGQSKLLAVNASIEAAKAGEHGKGFAVVAQEVKSLAEQSRQATAQVRTILGDIQQATSAAVLATEQGSHAVADGARQSAHAGQSITALSASVGEASQAAVQIAASSQQQLVGVDQVANAMESIKLASTQNVDSAKQMEGAAHGIKQLGEKIRHLVSNYRL